MSTPSALVAGLLTAADAQAHSSQNGWDPVSVPALWTLQP